MWCVFVAPLGRGGGGAEGAWRKVPCGLGSSEMLQVKFKEDTRREDEEARKEAGKEGSG